MYIEPNSTVRLLKGVPLDSDYNDTLYFASRDAQFNYFYNHAGYTLNNQSYQRVNKGMFRCSLPMSATYDVNYMMFKNTSFENHWFYAFVDKIEYTNNGMCEVNFTIDVIQTWLFNGGMQNALGQCFVEREIVADDTVGAHIEPESLDTGEQVYNGTVGDLALNGTIRYIVMLSENDETIANGRFYDGSFCGADLYVCDDGIYKILSKVTKVDEVIGIYTAPYEAFTSDKIVLNQLIPTGYSPARQDIALTGAPFATCGTTVNGYTPKNNKLLTYPFNYLVVMTGQGASNVYRYEYFNQGNPTFKLGFNLLPPVSVTLEPTNYKGVATDALPPQSLHNDMLTLDGYPMCSWNSDAYQAWQIQQGTVNQTNQNINSANNVISSIGNALSISAGILTGNELMAMMGAVGAGHTMVSEVQNITNTKNADYLASYMADVTKGNTASGSNILSNGEMKFYGGRMSVTANRAKQIDDFFSMFGYSVRVVKQPDINSRPRWNYVKCTDVALNCNMPTDDRNTVKKIFSNGIRFWKNASDIGNYSLANK